MTRPPPRSPLFPYTPLFRSDYSGPAATNLYIRHTPPSRAASILASVGGDRRRPQNTTRRTSHDATDVSEVDGGGIDGARGDGGRARHRPGGRAGSQRAARDARGDREAGGPGPARRGARPSGQDGRAAQGDLRPARS